MGAAQGRSTPAAGIEIVYAGLRDRLDALTLPALVVWGGRDRVVSPRYAEPLRDALPDGRLLLLPDAGHVPMCEAAGRGRGGGAGAPAGHVGAGARVTAPATQDVRNRVAAPTRTRRASNRGWVPVRSPRKTFEPALRRMGHRVSSEITGADLGSRFERPAHSMGGLIPCDHAGTQLTERQRFPGGNLQCTYLSPCEVRTRRPAWLLPSALRRFVPPALRGSYL